MATLLIIVIYAAFVGLGIPDSLFGTSWPSVYTEFGLPFSLGGVITCICSSGTMISSLLSARLIKRLGTNKLTAACTLLTGVSLFGFSFSNNFLFLCLLSLPLGLGAGSIDTALNNYVALHYSASQMSFLHCFYGVGVTVSPFIMTLVFRSGMGWRSGYRIASGIQLGLALLIIVTLPVWRKVHGSEAGAEEKFETLSLKEAAAIKGVKIMWLLFICSVTIEVSVGSWSSTFLVEHRHLNNEMAAASVTFYYLGMTIGRLLSGVFARRLHSWQIIKTGLLILGAALLLLIFVPNNIVTIAALMLIGLGNGPMFPNFNYLTPENFGESRSPAIIGTQMAVSSFAIITGPILCGLIGQVLGMRSFPFFLTVFYVLMLVVFACATRLWTMPRMFGRKAERADGE
ncbi:MAG: MFS transporter [Lachnospiraceae bacterium]|nr:MFS transporter [Lachnospiraceae bacterium]